MMSAVVMAAERSDSVQQGTLNTHMLLNMSPMSESFPHNHVLLGSLPGTIFGGLIIQKALKLNGRGRSKRPGYRDCTLKPPLS